MAPKGVEEGGAKGTRRVGFRRVGPKLSGPLSPGLGFGYGRVWGPGLNVFGFGVWAFWVQKI